MAAPAAPDPKRSRQNRDFPMSDDVRPDSSQPEPGDPGNDAAAAEEATEAAVSDTFEQASDSTPEVPTEDADATGVNAPEIDEQIDSIAEPAPAPKLDRL